MCHISWKSGLTSNLIRKTVFNGPAYVFVLFQASNTVEVDVQTAEKLQVSRLDFMASLNNDIKPVSWCVALICVFPG